MKRILIVMLANFLLTCCYAQQHESGKNDSIVIKVFRDNTQSNLILKKGDNLGCLMDSAMNSQGVINSSPSIIGFSSPEYFIDQFYDNMPCMKPHGWYKMRVYKPDTNSRYTLLIKKL